MWTCPNCAEQNDDNAPACAVCATRPQPAAAGREPPFGSPYPTLADRPYPAAADPWAPAAEPRRSVPLPFTPEPPPPTWTDPAPFPTAPIDSTPPTAMPPDAMPPTAMPSRSMPPASYPGAPEPPHRPLPTRWILAVALVFLVGVGVAAAIVVPRLFSSDDENQAGGTTLVTGPTTDPATGTADPTPTDTDPTEPVTEDPVTEDPTPTDPTPTVPTSSGIVAIDPSVAGDDRAADVATMFDTYFSGINDKDYTAVGSVLDPAGSVDPNDQKEMTDLADGTRSTKDSGVTLTGLSGAGGLLTAEVAFQSTQDPGDGPRGRTGETCTRWDIRYTVSGAPGAYRIRKSKASSAPC